MNNIVAAMFIQFSRWKTKGDARITFVFSILQLYNSYKTKKG